MDQDMKMLDGYLGGTVPVDEYQEGLRARRIPTRLGSSPHEGTRAGDPIAEATDLTAAASPTRVRFRSTDDTRKRKPSMKRFLASTMRGAIWPPANQKTPSGS